MAVDYQQVYRNVHDIVVEATGLDDTAVRPAYDNAPAQPTQDRTLICSINIINPTPVGVDSVINANQDTGTDLDETVYGDRNITASIKTYGGSAQNVAEQIILYLSTSAGIQSAYEKELGYLKHGQILNISSLQNGSWENRRQVDIEFHIVMSVENEVNAIESSTITWAFYGSSEITGTIEVNDGT